MITKIYKPDHDYNLRSLSKDSLGPDRINTVMASRGFSHSSSDIWNNLTDAVHLYDTIETFKKCRLKTELCKAAFTS